MAQFSDLPTPRGLDPLYFDRRRSLEGAFRWSGGLGDPRRCVDVGANIGQTMNAFLEWWPSATCISFEPEPRSYGELERQAAKWNGRASCRNVGVASSSGELSLLINERFLPGSSFRSFNREADTAMANTGLRGWTYFDREFEDSDRTLQVPTVSLDDHFNGGLEPDCSWAGDGVDVLKSDANGFDIEVLRGATATLAKTRVVLVEWQFDDVYGPPTRIEHLDRLLAESGFRFWDVAHIYKELTTLRTLWADLVYARPHDDALR